MISTWILLLASMRPAPPDASRILEMQQAQAMEARAQHREIARVQPESHLTAAEEAANHRAEIGRLVSELRSDSQAEACATTVAK
jgi:hypothetical protein